MAKPADPITDSTLLCERCGYILEGLDTRGACPECGKPIAESLPSARTGTPFQVSTTWSGFVMHCSALLRQPRALFSHMRIGAPDDGRLRAISLFGAAAIMTSPLAFLTVFRDMHASSSDALITRLWFITIVWLCTVLILELLTWVERIGITFFSRRRGWRANPDIAKSICANAAPGWIASGVLLIVGLTLTWGLLRLAPDLPASWRPWLITLAAACPILGFIAGMLIFETLVYIGVRQCRYANWIERPTHSSDDPVRGTETRV